MSITVKFFASVREKLGKSQDIVEYRDSSCPADVWAQCTQAPLPNQLLVAVNQEYASLSQLLLDGDEIAFFPPVTGG